MMLSAFLLGLAYCAPPGAVFAETLRRGMAESDRRSAMRTAWRVQIGSVIGDMVWASVALAGAAFLVQNAAARIVLGALGVLLMGWLAWSALRDARRGAEPTSHSAGSLAKLNATPSMFDVLGFFGSFLAATIVYAAAVALLVGYGRGLLTTSTYRIMSAVCGLFLAYKSAELAIALIAG